MAEAIEMPFASTTGEPRETPVAYSGPLRANTLLCSFNTIQPFSCYYLLRFIVSECLMPDLVTLKNTDTVC